MRLLLIDMKGIKVPIQGVSKKFTLEELALNFAKWLSPNGTGLIRCTFRVLDQSISHQRNGIKLLSLLGE